MPELASHDRAGDAEQPIGLALEATRPSRMAG